MQTTTAHMHRITITTTVDYHGDESHVAAHLLVDLVKAAVQKRVVAGVDRDTVTATAAVDAPEPGALVLAPILAIGPSQINLIAEPFVTVRYPPDATSVLSIQPNGKPETREEGTQGPYELAIREPDRVIYAPTGPTGVVVMFPFTDVIPNA